MDAFAYVKVSMLKCLHNPVAISKKNSRFAFFFFGTEAYITSGTWMTHLYGKL